METQNNTAKKSIVSAKEARQRSVTSKLTQLEEAIAHAVEKEIVRGKEDKVTVSVSGYSEAVISKAISSLRDQEYKVTVNRASINLAKNFANSITVSWGE